MSTLLIIIFTTIALIVGYSTYAKGKKKPKKRTILYPLSQE